MNIVTRIKHFRIWAKNINISEINKKIQEDYKIINHI